MLIETLPKICGHCQEIKPTSSFHKDKKYKDGLKGHCKECDKIYRNGNPRLADYVSNYNLKHRYGITLKDYEFLYEKQKGCCAICGRHSSEFKRRLAVDHNHKTGKVRGLLCVNCNRFLGLVKESRGLLLKMILYLKQ